MKAATCRDSRTKHPAEFQSTPPVKAATANSVTAVGLDGFQSTPPVKAATINGDKITVYGSISIHAAREGGDAVAVTLPAEISYFNPRRP